MISINPWVAWAAFILIIVFSFIPFHGYKEILMIFLALEFLKSRIVKLISLPFGPTGIAKFINNLGLEFVTVGSIIAGVLYGPFVGAAFGGICMITHYLGRQYFSLYGIVNIPMYILLGAISALLGPSSFVIGGIVLNIAYLVINYILLFAIFHPKIHNAAFFAITNIICNVIILNIAQPMI